MLRKTFAVILLSVCVFSITNCAIGDVDIYHVPTDQQVPMSEALNTMITFWRDLCAVELEEEILNKNYTALFGPGCQWGIDTEEDCWIIEIPFGADIPIRPLLIIHGTTGKILYWEYRDKDKQILYMDMVPDAEMLSDSEAVSIAFDLFSSACNYGGNNIDIQINKSFGTGKYVMPCKCDDHAAIPVWNILISFGEYYGNYYLSAVDGSVVSCSTIEETGIE